MKKKAAVIGVNPNVGFSEKKICTMSPRTVLKGRDFFFVKDRPSQVSGRGPNGPILLRSGRSYRAVEVPKIGPKPYIP